MDGPSDAPEDSRMLLCTTRFGKLECRPQDILLFPEGLIGFEPLRAWTLLCELPLVWLQSVEHGQVALPLVCPFLFVPQYRFRLVPDDRRAIHLSSQDRPMVLSVVGREHDQWTLNLRAPVVIHREARLGRQVITADEQPLRYVLPRSSGIVRKTA